MKYSHSCEAADKSLEEVRWSESTSDHSCEGKVPASKIQILKEDMQILSDLPECVSMSPSSEVLISRWQATNASSREAACGEDPEARSSDCITGDTIASFSILSLTSRKNASCFSFDQKVQ